MESPYKNGYENLETKMNCVNNKPPKSSANKYANQLVEFALFDRLRGVVLGRHANMHAGRQSPENCRNIAQITDYL